MKILVVATPNAKENKVLELNEKPENILPKNVLGDFDKIFKIYVTVVPENGKANKEIIKLLAKHLGVSKSSVNLVKGELGKYKVFEVLGK